ncbi:TIGR04282 family arsenosugar biosynthesis glycosyltransferase [Pedobacter glucosidilyticus]|uniref:TIGR04282 family arsenosugar biosynthesis glycosyltransferase n=1 Tax=Pedobacter glucosidilyticus TaxID=1122941 RepID=UPI0026EC95E9|nr:TIGR04282 family arsenosugar biosynthesis glycosyltransferase [Pedobacter glucosidilyticus]
MQESKEALIIFLKYPELGRAKTRLAASIGNEKALKVYIELLNNTNLITRNLKIDKFLYYDKVSEKKLDWKEGNYTHAYQIESDLGGRMAQAFEDIFNKGYEQVIIMGSDCYDLSSHIIEEAFKTLQNHDVVLGPAKDGGYYLIGLSKMNKQLFTEIEWSTEQVLKSTVQKCKAANLSYHLLKTLSDIDTVEDLTPHLKHIIK